MGAPEQDDHAGEQRTTNELPTTSQGENGNGEHHANSPTTQPDASTNTEGEPLIDDEGDVAGASEDSHEMHGEEGGEHTSEETVANPHIDEGENRPITIECLILPENHTFQVQFESNRLFGEAKARIGELLTVDPANLRLLVNGTEVVEDDLPIPHRLNPSSDVLNVQLEINYVHPVDGTVVPALAEDALEPRQEDQMIEVGVGRRDGLRGDDDVIDVNSDGDLTDRDQSSIVVSVTRDHEQPLPFLGGYRNKINGAEYYHASMQTDLVKEVTKPPPKFHRDTQTVDIRSVAQQTTREASTQMERKDLYIDKSSDRVLYSRPYFDSEQLHELQEEMAVKIQCAVRIYFARKRARRMIEEHTRDARESYESESRELAELEQQEREDMERRMYPRSKKDFKILFNELNDWVRQESEAINGDTDMTQEERKLRLLDLLEKETSLLQTIDRLRARACHQNKTERLQKTLIEMGKPKVLPLSLDGAVAEVQTPHTIRAKTLADLYNGLRLTSLSREERIDVMLHVKWTAKEFDCDLTREIVSLIDREIDLLKRRRPVASLRGLRKRLAELFLEFLETPEFNPEAARFSKVPANQNVAKLTATRVMWPVDARAEARLSSARRRDVHAQTSVEGS